MVRSYQDLRTVVGMIGIFLPFALLIGNWGFEPSISQYYYTVMRNLFVGALVAVSTFMFFYVGYDKTDNWLSGIVGVFALGVPFFPCEGWTRPYHLASALILFSMLGVFSLFRFTKGDPNMTTRKKQRNVIYKICGYTIFGSITALIIYFLSGLDIPTLIFWLEVAMLEAFGIAWLTKGGIILKDKVK